MIKITQITESKQVSLSELCNLLFDVVDNGASIGFLSSLSLDVAQSYWIQVFDLLSKGTILWIAEEEGHIVGSVQLSLCNKENGAHRAEVQKLFVLSTARGKGIASQLMNSLETYARLHERTLLVLDTQSGSKAESVYSHLEWIKAGEIPDYASSPDGTLHPTSFFYKQLRL